MKAKENEMKYNHVPHTWLSMAKYSKFICNEEIKEKFTWKQNMKLFSMNI